jgi:hypothetical protein
MPSQLLELRNRLDFFLRQHIRWRIPGKIGRRSNRKEMFEGLAPAEKQQAGHLADALTAKYRLSGYKRNTSLGNFQENLFYLHMLDSVFTRSRLSLPDPLKVIDIGPSHWFYIQALYHFLQYYRAESPRVLSIHGYEVDPYRVYADFHSRYDHALANIGELVDVEFIPFGFMRQSANADLVTMFFPFVFISDHQEWGLPARHFEPARLVDDAWNSLRAGGYLLIVNQGDAESTQQLATLRDLKIPVLDHFKMDDLLFKYEYDRYIILAGPHA